ncbi:nucleotide sugar epimerase [Thermanaerothrix daxensis]|uniref:Nucleotide sugar epimerase n=1 Tax=Thermanaerothrix daxensis TaxID=869279 RepID=A0A0P6YK81_9CHLR|nr:SDR family NAD(P)-dependent oxidoreductase [Thermanaerothrix daxensis]KPL82846.1 nucleotide sugar epimerase [Thermanaerothrix daxensis]
MKRYLLTGTAGFIGARVGHYLLEDGAEVVGVDNLNDAYDVRLKHWRLEHLRGRPNFHFLQLDIRDREAVEQLFARYAPFEAVINLAARAGVPYSVVNPWIYFETNVTGTLNLLEASRRFGVVKFVLASTSSLYGILNPMPFREDADTSHPLSPYAASKKAAETLCYTYHHLYGLDVTVFRYFTVYGPAGRPDMSLFRFCQWIAEGRPLHLYGDGSFSRDFTYVDDIARGTLLGLKPMGFEVINLGSDQPHTMMEAIRILEKALGRSAQIDYHPPQAVDMPATWADITKARTLLGWEPQITLEEGLQRLVQWYLAERTWASQIKTI